MLDRVLARIDRERLLNLAVEAVDRYTPTYAEGPATEVFAAALERSGVPLRRQPVGAPAAKRAPEDRANLVAALGPEPPGLLWVGHVDTVELSWEQVPGARLEDGLLWGVGSCDMKGACAAAVEALVAVHESGVPLARGVRLALLVGEEELGDGAKIFAPTVAAPVAIVGEPTGNQPCLDHFGYLELRLDCRGNRSHAALPEVGANAALAMLGWIRRILEGIGRDLDQQQIAFSLRQIAGGSRHFVVADSCEAHLDIHLAPDLSRAALSELVARARDQARERAPGCSFELEELEWAPGYALPRADPRLAVFERAFARLGLAFEPRAFRSHSDANLLRSSGTLPVVLGPGDLAVAHTRDEHVAVAELEAAARLYAAAIVEACADAGARRG